MVQLTRIYTRSGDKGETALGNGQRVPKQAVRVAAYGTVDETNAVLGVVRLHTAPPDLGLDDYDAMLARIQNDLFDLGADLCTPLQDNEAEGTALRITQPQVDRLEAEIDAMNATLAPLRSFILPGGCAAAAHLHHARTVCRRAERLVAELGEEEALSPASLRYINRLSDHLFVLARAVNARLVAGGGDVLWTPGGTR